MMVRLTVLLLASAILAGCASFPEVDAAERRLGTAGPPPVLVPLETVLPSAAPGRATEATAASVEGRAAGLRARAAALRNR
jgi:hypothetical protein